MCVACLIACVLYTDDREQDVVQYEAGVDEVDDSLFLLLLPAVLGVLWRPPDAPGDVIVRSPFWREPRPKVSGKRHGVEWKREREREERERRERRESTVPIRHG